MENLSKQQFEEMKCWNKNTIVEEDERSNKMKIKKKKMLMTEVTKVL